MQAEQQSEREALYTLIRGLGFTTFTQTWEIVDAITARAALSHQSPQGWQPISTAPEGELVVVGWLDVEDAEHPERHDFDFKEDGVWLRHSDNHEHFLMVAPPGSRGPAEKAPYTHWQRIGAIPAPQPPVQGGRNA